MWSSFLRHEICSKAVWNFKIGSARDAHQGDALRLCLEAIRHLATGLGKLCHDLLVQPDIHFRRAIKSAGVAEFLRQLFSGTKAAVQFQ